MPEPGRLPGAVIFDVDGTLVDSERHGHRVAFNLAFEELDLPWRWDEQTYGRLLRITGGQRRLDQYLDGEGVDDDRRAELVPTLHARKTEILSELVASGRIELRPGVRALLDDLLRRRIVLAVATTGSRNWVDKLLGRLLEGIELAAVVTGDDVQTSKPDPEAFIVALDRLGMTAPDAVAVEDSPEGLASAAGAGLACVVVLNDYTADLDQSGFDQAELVVDGFGEPGAPAQVRSDRVDSGWEGVLDAAVLGRVCVRGRAAK
ncbi:MAG: HAD-IA family hydrolase [Actinomycetota bacterium]|nr:HAD-IA family hydrolase [Actinomycetota bacterium]